MSDTPKENNNTPEKSLLGEILSTPDMSSSAASWDFPSAGDSVSTPSASGEQTPPPTPPKKKKEPMKPREFLKIVGALLLVALIFFGAFLAYIVFNPGQAQFFISFGINPRDISALLQRLASFVFGVFTFVLSVVWIIVLFRAILTKKEYRKKKTVATILSVFVGILLFSEISLWAYLIGQINATDYQNPNGGVIIYDNDKLLSKKFSSAAQLQSFDNLIGPLELKFDLKSDANLVGKLMNIDEYEITIHGAFKRNGKTNEFSDPCIIRGANPADDQGIICRFDEVGTYKASGVYRGIDKVTREEKTKSMAFPVINIVGVVDVKAPTGSAITYDATNLASLGKLTWFTEKWGNTPVSTDRVYSAKLDKEEQVLCLAVFSQDNCDKIFVIPSERSTAITARIAYDRDSLEDRKYRFRLENLKISSGEITGYEWRVNNAPQQCEDDVCDIEFQDYGEKKVAVIVSDSSGKETRLETEVNVSHSLELRKGSSTNSLLKISDSDGTSRIDSSYASSLGAYLISDIPVPTTLSFDATDVAVTNYGYSLDNVEWSFDGVKKTGPRVQYEFVNEKRYVVNVTYSFVSSQKWATSETLSEKIIIEPKKRDISANLKLTQDSEYAPATIRVDGSASQPKMGTITKFIYDFGEGKWPIEGDAIQDYRYANPGEYTIVFTVVKSDGTKESISRKIVLKWAPKSLVINSSVYSGTVGKPIDLDTKGSVGDIDSYEWDFWDGSSSTDVMPTHTYAKSGKYTVKLTVVYKDRRVGSMEKEIEVSE